MSSIVNGRRVFAALILAFGILAVHELRDQDRRSAANTAPAPFLAAKFQGDDAVTAAIRSESGVLTRIPVRNDSDRQAAGRVGKVVQDYGSFVLVAKNKEIEAKGYGLEEQTVETTINLPGASFDPLKQPPAGSLRLGESATANGDGYYVLQFGGTATDEWLKSIRNAGVEVLQYVPHQAYLVYGRSEAIARVANHKRVRWIGQYNTDQKLSPLFRKQLDSAVKGATLERRFSPIEVTKKGSAVFDVAVFARADLDAFSGELRQSFGRGFFRISRLQHNFFNFVRIELSLEDVEKVAALPDVFGIEPVMPSKNEDERAGQILAGNYVNPTTLTGPGYDPLAQFGTDGTGIAVSVVDDGVGIPGDGGFYITPENAVNAAQRGATPGSLGHGHLNATIIAGGLPYGPLGPFGYNNGIGIAPRAHIVNIPRNRPGYSGDDAQVYNDSVITPAPNGAHAMISNNSWGNDINDNKYQAFEAAFDGYVRDATIDPASVDPITLIFSAGNLGAVGLTRPHSAKNLIVVGNSESINTDKGGTNANNINDLASDSSRGPTFDGRIKPDIVAPGTAITGGRSGTNSLSGNIDAFHRWSSGTSHSAANISGVAALFSRWYINRSGERLTPSLIKAALINSAEDMNGENASAPIPNGAEGWGRPNLKAMFLPSGVNAPGGGRKYINEQNVLSETGPGFPLHGSVVDGSKPIRITLAWTDPPGVADPALVNNLDLVVTMGGSTVYKGNVFSNGVSVPGGVADTRNNVENVFLPAGLYQTGTDMIIEVRATALNGDGVLLNGDDTDQNYSLVVNNWFGLPGNTSYRLAGRVISASGRGIGRASVQIIGSQGVRETLTNPLGYFSFSSVAGNQSYTVIIKAKRYTFAQQTVQVTGNLTGLSFQANPGAAP